MYQGDTGIDKSDIIKKDEGNERTKLLRINELTDEGMIMVDDIKRQQNSIKLYSTSKGQEVAKHLEKVVEAFRQT